MNAVQYLLMAIGLIGLAAAVGFWQRSNLSTDPQDVVVLAPDLSCDLRAGGCSLPLPEGGTVSLAMSPPELPPMTLLGIEVVVEGTRLTPRTVEFVGVEMDMGFNRAQLKEDAAGHFVGTGMIPVCVTRRMLWEAGVLLSDGDTRLRAPFRFDVVRN